MDVTPYCGVQSRCLGVVPQHPGDQAVGLPGLAQVGWIEDLVAGLPAVREYQRTLRRGTLAEPRYRLVPNPHRRDTKSFHL